MKRAGNGTFGSAIDATALKKEIIGIMLMFGSLYLISAILSFHPDDEAMFRALPWHDIFSKAAKDTADTIHNHFGLFGARLSAFFVGSFIGYSVILPISSIFTLGWSLLRAKSLKPAILFFLFSVFISTDIATLFGLTSAGFSDVMAGAVGRMLAERLSTVIGVTGALVLLLVIAVALIVYMGRGVIVGALQGAVGFKSSMSKPFAIIAAKRDAIRKKKKSKAEAERESAGAEKGGEEQAGSGLVGSDA